MQTGKPPAYLIYIPEYTVCRVIPAVFPEKRQIEQQSGAAGCPLAGRNNCHVKIIIYFCTRFCTIK
jgi:hypothetical protein